MRFICLLRRRTANPQSFLPSLSPTPQLFEAIVRSFTPDSLTALIRFIGTPQIPKPPTRRKELLVIPLMASWGEVQILEKSCQGLESMELNMILNNLFISPSKQCTKITNQDKPLSNSKGYSKPWKPTLPALPVIPIVFGSRELIV